MKFLEKVKLLFIHPGKFFEKTRKETGIKDSVLMCVAFAAIGSVISYANMQLALQWVGADISKLAEMMDLAKLSAYSFAVGTAIELVFLFVFSAFIYLSVRLFVKGKDMGYLADARVVLYASSVTFLFSWLPVNVILLLNADIITKIILAAILAYAIPVWRMYLVYKGLSITHRISEWKAFSIWIFSNMLVALVSYMLSLAHLAV